MCDAKYELSFRPAPYRSRGRNQGLLSKTRDRERGFHTTGLPPIMYWRIVCPIDRIMTRPSRKKKEELECFTATQVGIQELSNCCAREEMPCPRHHFPRRPPPSQAPRFFTVQHASASLIDEQQQETNPCTACRKSDTGSNNRDPSHGLRRLPQGSSACSCKSGTAGDAFAGAIRAWPTHGSETDPRLRAREIDDHETPFLPLSFSSRL